MPLWAQRASKISVIVRFYGHTNSYPYHIPPHHPQNAELVWFIKVICTLCIRRSTSLDIFGNDYFRKCLNPFIAFNVIKHINWNFNNTRLAFRFFHFTRVNLNLVHSFGSYDLLLRSLCRMGIHDLAKVVFGYMKADGFLPDRSDLGFLVSSFAIADYFEIAKELLIAQAQSRCDEVDKINSFVYNNLLDLLVNRNRVHEAVCFFKEHFLRLRSFLPDTCSFNIIVKGLCRIGEADKAFDVFNSMRSNGCLPDVVTYNILSNGFCRVGNVDRARELLREIQAQEGFKPDVVTYTSVISGYCKLGKMEQASNLFDEMCNFGMRPNSYTFNALIDGFGKTGNMILATDLYEKMFCMGYEPDVITFTSLIDGHCRRGELDQGLKLWDEMNARNIVPNVYTFSILINALCKDNRLNEARNFIRQLFFRKDIVPKPFLYNPVIDSFCKAGNIDEANVIVKEMEEKGCKPDKLTFTILIIGHCMKGRMSDAIGIFHKMLAMGCDTDLIAVNSLVSCLNKAGMPKEAFRIKQTALEDLTLSTSSFRRPAASKENMDIPVAV